MPVSEEYQAYIIERLECVGEVTARKMFGGLGLYLNGIFFALVSKNTLYFKVDDSNRTDYEKAGAGPFQPYEEKKFNMNYYEVPAHVLDDDSLLRKWADAAFGAALRSKKSKKSKKNSGGGADKKRKSKK